MNKRIMNYAAIGAYALGLFGLNSCLKVDDTYDLDKDIDMTITVGGDLTLPGSSTEKMLLGDLLELEDDGIIKANETKGDYALVQKGESASTNINVDKVEINVGTDNFGGFNWTIPGYGNTDNQINFEQAIEIKNISNDNIPEALLRIESAKSSMPGTIKLSQASGATIKLVKGYEIAFPECMTVEYKTNNVWRANGNKLILDSEEGFTINSNSEIPFKITKIDFENKEAEEGTTEGAIFYYNSHKITLNGNIQFTGDISVDGTVSSGSKIKGNVESEKITLESVNGTIKPESNNNKIEIGELPDFLNGDDVIIDVTDPRIYLTVTNSTDAKISLSATLTSKKEGANDNKVNLDNIDIPAGEENYKICIHQNDAFDVDGHEVIVENLSSLIERIPDAIDFEIQQIEASEGGITLGSQIEIQTDYELNTPLMFGSKTNIKYEEVIDGWTTDLENAEFETVEVLMTVINEIPLGLNIQAIAIDKNGNKLDNVNIESNIDIEAGTTENAKTKEAKLAITALDGSIKGLDGIKLIITATASESTAGTALNENQTLKFDEIKLRLKGGITMDLN